MMTIDCDPDPEERMRARLFLSPDSAREFFTNSSAGASRPLLEDLPNRDWGRFLLSQLGAGDPTEQNLGGWEMLRTYPCRELGGVVLERENMLTGQASYSVARAVAEAAASSAA